MLFIRTRHSLEISGVIPFVKLQNYIETVKKITVKKTMKNEMESSSTCLFLVELWCFLSSAWKIFLFFSVYSTQYLVSTKNNYISEDVCTN